MSATTHNRSLIGAADPELDRLIEELTRRVQAGEDIDLEAFVREHPGYTEPLRRLLPALELLAGLSQSVMGEGLRRGASGGDPDPTAGLGELGDFRLVREIGRGGMGVVYEAEQLSLRRRVALKVLPFAAALDARQIQRFRVEAQAAACLHHPHIVPVHGVGCERVVHYYAMQLIEGQSLAAMIAELRRIEGLDPADAAAPAPGLAALSTTALAARLLTGGAADRDQPAGAGPDSPTAPVPAGASPPGEPSPRAAGTAPGRHATPVSSTRSRDYVRAAARLALQAAEALDHAHAQGVLHRDVKPANLLLDAGGRLWVTDFGLAQVRGDDRLTCSGDVLGTLRYMSPEQALGRRVVIDGQTDVYSLGVTLYELLTLRPAQGGRDRAEVLRRIAEQEPTPPCRLNPAVPADLETIVLKATSKNPAARYATAGDLAGDLGRFLEGQPIRARRPSVMDRAAKWSRRHRPVVMTAALLLVVGTAASTWQAIRAMKAERQASASAEEAKTEASIAQAVNDFLLNDLLAQANPTKNARASQVTLEAVLNKAAARITGKFAGQPKTEAAVRMTIARTYEALGLFPEAQLHAERAIELRRRALGPERPGTLLAMRLLADVYVDRGMFDKAGALNTQVLDVQRRVRGAKHLDTLNATERLAFMYRAWGKFEKAESLFTQNLEAHRRVLGAEHRYTLTAMHNVACMYHDRGELKKAASAFAELLDVRRRVCGAEHPDTLHTMNNLAFMYRELGKFEQAEPLAQQVLELRRRVLGAEHPHTLKTMDDLAQLYSERGKPKKAEPLRKQVLEIQRRVLGAEHADTLEAMISLANVYLEQRKYDQAEPLFAEVLNIGRRVLGAEHPKFLKAMSGLAICYNARGRNSEAESLLKRALKVAHRVLGPGDQSTLAAMHTLAEVYMEQVGFEKAEPLMTQLLEVRRRVLGPEHPHTVATMHGLAVVYAELSQYAKAERLYTEVLERARRVLGAEHPDTLGTMNDLAALYDTLGQYAKAEPLYTHVLEQARRMLGSEHPKTLVAMNNLAALDFNMGQFDKAELLYTQALDVKRRVLGPEHPSTLSAMGNLAVLYRDMGQYGKAEVLSTRALEAARRSLRGDHPDTARLMATLGSVLLKEQKYAEAEPILRECLAIGAKIMPGDWQRFLAESLLGGSLLGRKMYAEAEPLLRTGYEGMKTREAKIPAYHKARLNEAGERVVQLYEAWGKPGQAAAWKMKLGLAELPADVFAPQ
jgi:serine/threonine protein kinase/tetratricopeptide (TPR) repeat protein